MSMEVTVQSNVFHVLHSAGVLTSTDEKYLGQEYQERPNVGQWVSICSNLGACFFDVIPGFGVFFFGMFFFYFT